MNKITTISMNSHTIEVWRGASLKEYPTSYRLARRLRSAINANPDRVKIRRANNSVSEYWFK